MNKSKTQLCLVLSLVLTGSAVAAELPASHGSPVDFEREIAPIF
ncbi:MAG: hypothetical protein ACJASX_003783, partial [Limisphaerales bacterium]